MEIKIISTEIIKPSSPTPQHLRTHKLFLPNHVMPDLYVPFTFFYSSPRENLKPMNNNKISVHLKNALSKTLTYYYPFAGQNIDGVSTQCNDHGAIFIETQVANIRISDVLKRRDKAQDLLNLKNLLPFNGMLPQIPTTATTACHPNLFVQVNYFPCGGIAITIFFSPSLVGCNNSS
ncbi:Vinorine synthase [Melia azedarach]|uniref:Vinorine synthase n=1 Tax=Melia azedarach TaxID=155640 RepID=A0ACC1XSD2_MELAZ|nr:Vinorine synthase [Melia azedarach]